MCKVQADIRRQQGKSITKMLPDLLVLLKKRKEYEKKSSKAKLGTKATGHHVKVRPDSSDEEHSIQSSIMSKTDAAEMKYDSDCEAPDDYSQEKSSLMDDLPRGYQSDSILLPLVQSMSGENWIFLNERSLIAQIVRKPNSQITLLKLN